MDEYRNLIKFNMSEILISRNSQEPFFLARIYFWVFLVMGHRQVKSV